MDFPVIFPLNQSIDRKHHDVFFPFMESLINKFLGTYCRLGEWRACQLSSVQGATRFEQQNMVMKYFMVTKLICYILYVYVHICIYIYIWTVGSIFIYIYNHIQYACIYIYICMHTYTYAWFYMYILFLVGEWGYSSNNTNFNTCHPACHHAHGVVPPLAKLPSHPP